jgi:allantoicase
MPEQRNTLGELERDRVWRSSLTGAHYRWYDGRWESRRKNREVWYPVYVHSGPEAAVVRSYGGETFWETEGEKTP